MTLSEMLRNMSSDGAVDLPVGWTQGRTAFGGLSTALAYQAAKDIDADLPPLRSAQIAFTGPLSGRLSATARILRRGRSTAFVAADVAGDDGPGLHCSFVFAKPRETTIATEDFAPPQFPPLPQAQQIRSGPEQFFTSQMEFVGKRIDTSIKTNRLTRWMRLKQRGGLDPAAEILCISDSLPPSVMGLLETNAMVSSMNWQINIIAPEIRTTDGWWLIDSHTHHAAGGSSSQFMSVWNSERELIAAGMQSVAYYA